MNFHKVTMEEVARVIENGIGLVAFQNLAANLPEVGVKFDVPIGQLELFYNNVDIETLKRWQAGEVKPSFEVVVRSLYDNTGRVIPPHGFKPLVTDENTDFYLDVEITDKDIYGRMEHYLPYSLMPFAEFQDKCGVAKEKAMQHPQIGPNAFKRCHIPLPLPHIPELTDIKQLGQVTEVLLKAAGKSHQDEFNNSPRKFINHFKSILAGHVNVVIGTRHDRILTAISQAPQAGIFQPSPLQGYSIEADRAIINLFPDFVSLAGIEYILAMIACPDILARDYSTPGLVMAALQWRFTDFSFYFRTGVDRLDFDNTDGVAAVYAYYSGGLLILG